MGFSSLIKSQVLASENNYTQGRKGYKICKITPHHMAGVLSGEQCAKLFQNPNRQASSNYCIGNDGEIVGCVDENNRAWTSSNRANDCQAITIEVSNSEVGGDWKISDTAWNSLVNLCVDICKRYGFRLNYDGTKNGSLTRHNMFAKTTCPGPYLQGRFQELADTVNSKLDGNSETVQQTPSETNEDKKSDIKSDGKINCIFDIQEYLNRIYGTNLALDDIYGPKTKSAMIKGYQIELNRQFDKRIVEDGIWGPKTKSASINVKQGASGRITYLIQMALFIKGYVIEIDGKFGSDTARIVAQFQKDNGLTVDKIVGKNTSEKLFN